MDGIKILQDENKFPICSGYKCENIIKLKYENDPLINSCVPFGLVVFPNTSSRPMTNNIEDFLQVDTVENDNIEVQNKLFDKLLKTQCSLKASNKTCNNRSKLKLEKTRKMKR